ncbi:MAG: hypothetical protein ACYC1L_15280 [Alphaproteobacteria bacterium]
MIRMTITALALSVALAAGSARALTWETPKGESVQGGQAQVADPDDKLQQRMGMTNSSGPNAPGNPNMYKFQGSGFSFGLSGPQGQRDDQSNALRFGPSTPSDKRPSSRLNSVFGPGWQ